MMPPHTELLVTVRTAGRAVRLALPTDVFATAVEQLRWDALRSGLLRPEQWREVQASVSPAYPDDAGPTTEFAFAIVLHGPAKPVRRIYRPQELQALCLYLRSRLPAALEAGTRVELHWAGREKAALAPAPLDLPLADVPVREATSDCPPFHLVVSEVAGRQLAGLGEESSRRGVELAGCLHGRVTGLDGLAIDALVRAPDDGASSESFRFGPRFWAAAGPCGGAAGPHIVGWAHSHLCDQGHPRTLSTRDLVASHLYFSSPWSVAALVCASQQQPEVRWFGWQDAAMVDLSGSAALAS